MFQITKPERIENALREREVIKLHNILMSQCHTHLHLKLSNVNAQGSCSSKPCVVINHSSYSYLCLLKPLGLRNNKFIN